MIRDNSESIASIQLPQQTFDQLQRVAIAKGFLNVAAYLVSTYGGESDSQSTTQTQSLDAPLLQEPAFSTILGAMHETDAMNLLESLDAESVDLLLTSPPFGLVRKKAYGNQNAEDYLDWFAPFAAEFRRVLKSTGSLVIDIGGAWLPGRPTRSLYHYDLLLMLCRRFDFHLSQEIYWWNPARLPTPAEWVTIRRIRLKDAVNCVWWLSTTPFPKASNRRVLQPYSESMEDLLRNGYTSKKRPSGHDISNKFGQDNGGAIPSNLIALANTQSTSRYFRYCQDNGLPPHPARFPAIFPAFFLRMLTDPGDLVVDPFAGSGVTGAVCEQLGRRWLCSEIQPEYVKGAQGWFPEDGSPPLPELLAGRHSAPYLVHPPSFAVMDENEDRLDPAGGQSKPTRK